MKFKNKSSNKKHRNNENYKDYSNQKQKSYKTRREIVKNKKKDISNSKQYNSYPKKSFSYASTTSALSNHTLSVNDNNLSMNLIYTNKKYSFLNKKHYNNSYHKNINSNNSSNKNSLSSKSRFNSYQKETNTSTSTHYNTSLYLNKYSHPSLHKYLFNEDHQIKTYIPDLFTSQNYAFYDSFSLLYETPILNRLTKEINNIVDSITMTEYQKSIRCKVISKISNILYKYDLKAKPYGSYQTNLSLSTSDIDISVFSDRGFNNQQEGITKVVKALSSEYIIKHGSLHVIRYSRVPLIKFIEKEYNIQVDITITQDSSVISVEKMNEILNKNPVFLKIILLVKLILRQFSLNDASIGGVSSFVIFHMTYCYYNIIQDLLNSKNKTLENDIVEDNTDENNISKFLIGFFKFFCEFNHEKYTILTETMTLTSLDNKYLKDNHQHIDTNINSLDKDNCISSSIDSFFDFKKLKFQKSIEGSLSIQNIFNNELDVGTASREYSKVKNIFLYIIKQINKNSIEGYDKIINSDVDDKKIILLKKVVIYDSNFNKKINL